MLSSDQVAFYREKGYLAVPGAVDHERIAAASAALAQLIERSRQVRASDTVYDLEDAHRPDNPRVRRIKEPHRVEPIFAELLADPAITDMVTQLIGPDLRYEHTKLNIKPSRGGEPVEWHQDWAFYPHTNDNLAAVGVMFDDMELANGPLTIVPGSHRGPIFDHHVDGIFCGAMDPANRDCDYTSAVPLTGKAGSITVHHVRAVHGSAPNVSDMDRRLLLFQFRAADAWPILGFPAGIAAFEALMVAGQSRQPRLAPAPVRLPLPPAAKQGSLYENQKGMKTRFFAMEAAQ
jgi:phytanoyl-CoA hydroxylase